VSEGKRVYRSALRAEQAQRTRAAVVTAASDCFVARGYAGTTMKDVAEAAGVAVQTVFGQGSKAALLLACVDRALVGDDEEVPLRQREHFTRLLEADQKAAKLAVLREMAVDRVPAIGPIVRAFRNAAGTDPEIAASWAEYERRRASDTSVLVASFGPFLRADLDVERAVDVVWSVFAADTSDRFLSGRGWTVEQYADWLVDAVDRLLLR
jgi:AcrR family transcriptional regulator